MKRRLVELAAHDWPARRPFTDPRLAQRDCEILIGMLQDVLEARGLPAQPDSPKPGRDRLVITQSGRHYAGGPVSIVGFFGERNPDGNHDVADAVESVNAQMVADFDRFPLLLAYLSRLLDDGFNYANLVVLAGADGIQAFRELPQHAGAATDLAPRFYNSVRIYNGSIATGLESPRDLKLHIVKFWDYGGRRVWQATRRLD